MPDRVLMILTAPPESVEALLEAIASAGGGQIGNYTHCAFIAAGQGRFKPNADADPYSGQIGQISSEPEIRIETSCDRVQARRVLRAIRAVHPYEEPVIHVVPLLDEDALEDLPETPDRHADR